MSQSVKKYSVKKAQLCWISWGYGDKAAFLHASHEKKVVQYKDVLSLCGTLQKAVLIAY